MVLNARHTEEVTEEGLRRVLSRLAPAAGTGARRTPARDAEELVVSGGVCVWGGVLINATPCSLVRAGPGLGCAVLGPAQPVRRPGGAGAALGLGAPASITFGFAQPWVWGVLPMAGELQGLGATGGPDSCLSPLQGTNYRKTNPALEIRRTKRDSFWAQAEVRAWRTLCQSGSQDRAGPKLPVACGPDPAGVAGWGRSPGASAGGLWC